MTDLWLRRLRPNPAARLRLFCFPFAGGSASIYRTWPEGLPADVEAFGIQLPGRENRLMEAPHTSVPLLLEPLTAAVAPYLDRTTVFFGHSLGSLIAFELARTLHQRGLGQPARLIVSARRAPQVPPSRTPVHNLSDAEFLTELRRLNGTPPAVLEHQELMELLLPVLRADFALSEAYRFPGGEPLDCPITAFGAIDDAEVSREALAAWREQTRSEFALHLFPGGHFYLVDNPDSILAAISGELHRT